MKARRAIDRWAEPLPAELYLDPKLMEMRSVASPTDPRLTDELTGLSNEWHFRILFEFAFVAGVRGAPLTLVLFEVEGFEEYRTENGSDAADEALRRFGGLLADTSREMDLPARLDGARFAALLRGCNPQGGLILADRVQRLVRSAQEGQELSIAVGIAAYESWMTEPDELMTAAEEALTRSLRAGSGAVRTSRDR